jgi:hypothetical protein
MQFPDDSVVGETLIVLSLDSEKQSFSFQSQPVVPQR